jgi:hypothetical protein
VNVVAARYAGVCPLVHLGDCLASAVAEEDKGGERDPCGPDRCAGGLHLQAVAQ